MGLRRAILSSWVVYALLMGASLPAEALHVVSSRTLVVPAVIDIGLDRIVTLPDASAIVAGRGSDSKPYLVSVDSGLNPISSVTLSGLGNINGINGSMNGMVKSSDGNIVVLTTRLDGDVSPARIFFHLIKLTTGLSVIGEADIYADQYKASIPRQRATAIFSHQNGSIYVGGAIESTSGQQDCWIGRVDSSLALVSSITILGGGPIERVCLMPDMTSLSGGDIVGVATHGDADAVNLSDTRILLARLTQNLILVSSNTYDYSAPNSTDAARRITRGAGDSLWAVGASSYYPIVPCSSSGGDFWTAGFDAQLQQTSFHLTRATAGTFMEGVLTSVDPEGFIWSAGKRNCHSLENSVVNRFSATGDLIESLPFPVQEVYLADMAASTDGTVWFVGKAYKSDGSNPILRLALEPRAIVGISAAAVGIASVVWSWTGPSRFPADSYRMYRPAGGLQVASGTVRTFVDAGHGGNSLVALTVSGVNESGEGQLATGVTVYTLAAAPETAVLGVTSAEALSLSWSTAGNSAATPYSIYLSTGASPATNGFSGNRVSSTTAATFSLSALLPGTTYFVALKATNGDGVDTALVSVGSAKTLSLNTPVLTGGALGVSSISWSWADVSGETGYRVVDGAGASLSGDLAAGTSEWIETALSTNATYSRRVVAFGGPETSTSAAVAVFTLAAPPQALAFDAVFTSSFSASWATNTNPAGTSYRLSVWEVVAGSSTLTTTASSAAVTGLIGGATYFVSLEALNGDGLSTRGPPAVSTSTLAGGTAAPGEVITIQLPSGRATVDVPSSAFAPGVTVTVEPPGPLPGASGGTGLAGTGVGVRITASGSVQPQQRVAIGLPYRDADVAGLDQSRLLLARYDEARRVWVPLDSRVDTAAKRVTGTTDHFSLFQVMQAGVASGLDAPRVFPNPLRPSRGHTGMTFDTLPAGARVRVYTLLGELVRDLTANGAGLAFWDGKNASGAFAASGVYAVFIQGDGQSKTLKVAVQR